MAVPTLPDLSRREALLGTATALTGTAAYLGAAEQFGEPELGRQMSLEITTVPADSNPHTIDIAQRLKTALETVGIDAPLTALPASELTTQVLSEHDFDIYVGQFPYQQQPDPDALYSLFRSSFGTTRGWQNPFGYINYRADQLLDSQRRSRDRGEAIDDLQWVLARTQPVAPIVAPDRLSGVRTDRFIDWQETAPTATHNLLRVTPQDSDDQTLRLATTTDRITENQNPISASFSQEDRLIDLVYDSLLIRTGDDLIEWLARDIRWSDDTQNDSLEATVTLRDWPRWHDGRFLSAADVAFTYRFLADTSLGGAQTEIPSPRYFGRASIVSAATVTDRHELTIEFETPNRAVAERALTVPILPQHIWRERTEVDEADAGGLTTTALQTANGSPVGSGPLQFDSVTAGQQATLTRFEPHFLWRDSEEITIDPETIADPTRGNRSRDGNTTANASVQRPADNETVSESVSNRTSANDDRQVIVDIDPAPLPPGYDDSPPFETVIVQVAPSDETVAALLSDGTVDASRGVLGADIRDRITDAADTEVIVNRSNTIYHLGFNTRRRPLRNPHFRRVIARLLDREEIVADVFEGNGAPATDLLSAGRADSPWLPAGLEWQGEHPEVPFFGTEGELDVEGIMNRFRELGYEYSAEGNLVDPRREP